MTGYPAASYVHVGRARYLVLENLTRHTKRVRACGGVAVIVRRDGAWRWHTVQGRCADGVWAGEQEVAT